MHVAELTLTLNGPALWTASDRNVPELRRAMSERVADLMMSVTRLPRLVSPVRIHLNRPSRSHSILYTRREGRGERRERGREESVTMENTMAYRESKLSQLH